MSTVIFISIGFLCTPAPSPSIFISVSVFILVIVVAVVYTADISFDAQLSSFVLPRWHVDHVPHMSVHLSVCLSVCLLVCLSMCVSLLFICAHRTCHLSLCAPSPCALSASFWLIHVLFNWKFSPWFTLGLAANPFNLLITRSCLHLADRKSPWNREIPYPGAVCVNWMNSVGKRPNGRERAREMWNMKSDNCKSQLSAET